MNVFVVGINQLVDVDIDSINKPYLPLVSGRLSNSSAQGLIAVCAVLSVSAGLLFGMVWSFGMLAILFLGTLYSCEPFRLKKRAFWAGLTIATCRGVLFNFAAYFGWLHVLGLENFSSKAGALHLTTAQIPGFQLLLFYSAFMFVFVLAIGVLKDLPDFEGDKLHRVISYAVRYGRKNAFLGSVALLISLYSVLLLANFNEWGMRRSYALLLPMGLSLFILAASTRIVKNHLESEFTRFYRIVWGLFYLGICSFAAYASAV